MQVPLLDMRRYHTLLAGASWMAEYGDPDKPEEWAYISKYSPYQNLKANTKYPRVLFTTTTRDESGECHCSVPDPSNDIASRNGSGPSSSGTSVRLTATSRRPAPARASFRTTSV